MRRRGRRRPFDSGVSYRPGARFGPAAIREASRLLRPYHPGLDVEPFATQQVADAGDIAGNPFDILEAVAAIEEGAERAARAGARLVTIGGDHTIALPLLRSVVRRHGPVALLHFDAHLDTWDTYFGARYTHGTPFRRAPRGGSARHRRAQPRRHPWPALRPGDLVDDARMGFGIVTSMDVMNQGVSEVVAGSGTDRRPAALRLRRHRRAGPRARAGHRHAGGGRASPAASCSRSCAASPPASWSAADVVEVAPPTTTPR